MWNAISQVQDLNSCRCVHFLQTITTTPPGTSMSIDRLLLKAFIHQLHKQNSSLSRGVEGFLHNNNKERMAVVCRVCLQIGLRKIHLLGIYIIISHILPAFLESLMPFKNWCSIHARCSKNSMKHSIRLYGIFPSLKLNFIAYRSSKVSSRPDWIFEIHQLWQSGFSREYSDSYCSCSFEPEIIKISQSSHKMYSNNIGIFKSLWQF